MSRRRWRSWIAIAAMVVVGLLLVAQLVPYGRDHSNPPIVAEPAWDSPTTRALADRACFDCHSNQTRWPWYSHVAPTSWLVQHHVDEGRQELNFSVWNRPHQEAAEAAKTVRDGEMPPRSYLLLHPEARLTAAERDQLARGLDASLASTGLGRSLGARGNGNGNTVNYRARNLIKQRAHAHASSFLAPCRFLGAPAVASDVR